MLDPLHRAAITAIANDDDLTRSQKLQQAGKITREAAVGHHKEGKSASEIAELLGIDESRVRTLTGEDDIQEYETIWFPGIYHGRQDDEYTKPIGEVSEKELIALVQKRAKEDGEWAIANGFVGDNEDKMRKMMAWVSREDNILQCYNAAIKEAFANVDNEDYEVRTVDWICRDLANGSKWVGSGG